MKVITFLFILLCLNCEAQVIYFSSGFGTNSGAHADPYTGSAFISFPWLLETEVKLDLTKFPDISIFGRRNVNKKKGEAFLSGTSTKSLSHYLGLKFSETLNRKQGVFNRRIGIGCSVAYGNELVKWNDQQFSIFSPSSEISGHDEFKYLQAGILSFINWEKSQWNIRLTLSFLKDFVVNGSRQINNSSNPDLSKYQDFEYEGLFSFNFQGGIGVRFFK